jgi:hypothetical protein
MPQAGEPLDRKRGLSAAAMTTLGFAFMAAAFSGAGGHGRDTNAQSRCCWPLTFQRGSQTRRRKKLRRMDHKGRKKALAAARR